MAVELDRSESDAILRERGVGVLSFARDDVSYAVPVSFGYDGEHCYFQFVYEPESRKMAFLDATAVASLTVYAAAPTRSVLVRGPLELVPDAEEHLAASAIADNADIPMLRVTLDADDRRTFEFYRLVTRDVSGRRFEGFVRWDGP